jgi:hypothetical protein
VSFRAFAKRAASPLTCALTCTYDGFGTFVAFHPLWPGVPPCSWIMTTHDGSRSRRVCRPAPAALAVVWRRVGRVGSRRGLRPVC